jgi:hypothetical protein
MEATNRERWKSVNGYANYEISSCGRVRNATTERMLKPSDRGYQVINLTKNGKPKQHYVHRLVAEAFIDNPEEKRCVDHIDGNKANNHLENLRWATHTENSRNQRIQTNTSSRYKGVYLDKRRNKWMARINTISNTVFLGYFANEREAGIAYNLAAVEHFKQFANLNVFED